MEVDVFGQQAGRSQLSAPALHRVGDEVVGHAPLHLAGLHSGEDALGEVHSPLGARAVRQLALDHVVAQRPLCGIVSRWHQRVAQERPQRGPHLDQVRAGIGCAAATPAGYGP
jgi:hypothetical protein